MCDEASKSRVAARRCRRWEELRSLLGVPWGAAGSGHREAVLSQLKFRFQKLASKGTLDTAWNLVFNHLGVSVLSCRGRP